MAQLLQPSSLPESKRGGGGSKGEIMSLLKNPPMVPCPKAPQTRCSTLWPLLSTFLHSPPPSVLNPHPTVMHPLSPAPTYTISCCHNPHSLGHFLSQFPDAVPVSTAPSKSEQISPLAPVLSLEAPHFTPLPRQVLMSLNCPQDWGHGE